MRFSTLLLVLLAFALATVGCAAPMAPEDCFEDEVYDPVDQICYLACEDDGSCYEDNEEYGSWIDGLLNLFADLAFGFGSEEAGNVLVRYDIENNELTNPQEGEPSSADDEAIMDNRDNHEAIWRSFAQLIPSQSRSQITQFGVFTDGKEETMAYVEPNKSDPTTWALVIDVVDAENEKEIDYTLVHEYGHVLTLNNNQVPFNADAYFSEDETAAEDAENACSNFYTGEGCANPMSYINQFYQRFWADVAAEHREIDQQDPDALYAFYEDNQDRFVSDYAATNPGEDIAESWTHFVMSPKPEGNAMKDQKVLFFYDYPELVELRSQILSRLYSQSRR